MKTSWPRVEIRLSYFFDADHTLPWQTERHRHSYWLECGYCHEINPTMGVTKTMEESKRDGAAIVERISGKYLNDVLPVPPTAEMLVCWILANLPPYWDFVQVRCYGAMQARIERHNLTTAWLGKLRADPA